MLAACFAIGWFVLLADEYKHLGKQIVGGAAFISNFLLWRESGYFDVAADTKPLLHLWTLAIEEQFYIIWPLMLWFAWKQRLNLLTIAIIIAIISFSLNLARIHDDAVAAFYSPQTRFWELMAGAILAYIGLFKQRIFDAWPGMAVYAKATEANSSRIHNAESLLGAVLIVAGILIINKEFSFPGWWAVLPTLGTVLIISAGPHAWLNRTVLSRRILVWFGLISYPLYLWHWPLLSFARIVEGETPSSGIRIAASLVSIVLARATYVLIEKPIRFGKHGEAKTITLATLMVVVCCAGYLDYRQDGLPFRNIITRNGEIISSGNVVLPTRSSGNCPVSDQVSTEFRESCLLHANPGSGFRIIVWGDSHAKSWRPVFEKIARHYGYELYVIGSRGCPPIENVRRAGDATCKNLQASTNILDSIVKLHPNLVF